MVPPEGNEGTNIAVLIVLSYHQFAARSLKTQRNPVFLPIRRFQSVSFGPTVKGG